MTVEEARAVEQVAAQVMRALLIDVMHSHAIWDDQNWWPLHQKQQVDAKQNS